MISREKVAELLLDVGAVTVNLHTPFRYASGLISPIYTDCRLLASSPRERTAIVEAMIEQFNSLGVRADVVIGVGTSGAWLAAHVSKRLSVPMAYVRASSKDHGKQKKMEGGNIYGSQKALLLSDIISTEKDVLEALQAVKSIGAIAICCVAIFSNNIGQIENTLREQSVPLLTLTDLQTLLSTALSKGKISPEDKVRVDEWLSDPSKWEPFTKGEFISTLDRSKDEVADVLVRIGSVSFSPGQPYKFSSGLLSPIYIDTRRLISFPTEWEYTLSFFEKVILDDIGLGNIDVIAGVAMGGIPHAARLADRFGIAMAYVKSAADEHGKRSRIEGRIERGNRIIVIEDVVTTGRSIVSAAGALRDAGGTVSDSLAIFTYELEEARGTLQRAGLSLLSLTNLGSLLDAAVRRGIVSDAEVKAVRTWHKNPWGWSGDVNSKGQ